MQYAVKRLPIVQISILFAQNWIARKQGNGNQSQRLLLYTSICLQNRKLSIWNLSCCAERLALKLLTISWSLHIPDIIGNLAFLKFAAVWWNLLQFNSIQEIQVVAWNSEWQIHMWSYWTLICAVVDEPHLSTRWLGGIHGLVGTREIDSPKSLIATNFLPFKAAGILFASWITNPCKCHKANKSLRDMKELHHHPGLVYWDYCTWVFTKAKSICWLVWLALLTVISVWGLDLWKC